VGFVFCVFFKGFVLWWVLFFTFFSSPKSFFITNNFVITYKLSIIEGFYHKVKDFPTILVFISFCHDPRKITKEEKKIEIKKCVINVNM